MYQAPLAQPAMPGLNTGQQAAADAFFQFLFSDDKEFNISGGGGVGKTYLMGHLIDKVMPEYQDTCKMMGIDPKFDEVVMTATTNKAAEVLAQQTNRPTQTIHSFLNLKVKEDLKTGKMNLSKTNGWKVHERLILFVDECSMIDSDLYFFIHGGTANCKIVYVGDHCQMAPVMEVISPVYRNNIPVAHLTEPMRNANQPALMALCQQMRNTVETGEFGPIQLVPGVIDHLSDEEMEYEITQHFSNQNLDDRILAYTNARVVEYNDHIRDLRGLPARFQAGQELINASALQLPSRMLPIEQELRLDRVSNPKSLEIVPNVTFEYVEAMISIRGVPLPDVIKLPVDREHFKELLRWTANQKLWDVHYNQLKKVYADFRQRDACTVYKAQGSTHGTVFVDLGNISTCHNPNQVARQLYVAVSRPRARIAFYGDLAPKYGTLVH